MTRSGGAKGKTTKTKRRKAAAPLPPDGRFVVVANLKGGSGKSTLAFNLAVHLAHRGRAVDLVDLDPQKTLTDLVAVRAEVAAEPVLAAPGATLGDRASAAWTIVDVGAADLDGMVAAIGRADLVLVPVLPGQADVWATERHLAAIDRVRPDHCAIRLFLNRADPGDGARETREAAEALGELARRRRATALLPARLSSRVAFRRSLSEGAAVFELDRKSKAAAEFEALVAAILTDPAIVSPASDRPAAKVPA
jgi:chromosome partitioning protein